MNRPGTILMCFVAFFLTLPLLPASAQQGKAAKLRMLMERTTPEQRARFQDLWMKRSLKLTSHQAARVAVINLRTARRMQSIYNSDGGRLRMYVKMMRTRHEKEAELRGVLTRGQFARYEAKKEAMRQKMRHMHGT